MSPTSCRSRSRRASDVPLFLQPRKRATSDVPRLQRPAEEAKLRRPLLLSSAEAAKRRCPSSPRAGPFAPGGHGARSYGSGPLRAVPGIGTMPRAVPKA